MTIIDDTAANSGASQTQQDASNIKKNTDGSTLPDSVLPDASKVEAVEKVESKQKKGKEGAESAKGDAGDAPDWRLKYAGGDEKELKRLSRFASEQDIYKSFRELEKLKSSGQLKKSLPENPTEEELVQWRKENNVPDSPDKYDLSFDDGLVIGDDDKPLIDEFVKNMHGKNATPDQVKTAISTYYDIMGRQQEAIAEKDSDYQSESIIALKEEWGGDYKKNVTAVSNLLDNAPEGIKDLVATARAVDGSILGNNPEVMKWFASLAYEINPVASVMPSSVSNPSAGLEDEILSIEKLIGDKSSSYWKGPGADKMQARYRELIDARIKMAGR